MGAAALSACGPGETGPLESAWTEAEGETTCRMISAGWGAPMEAAATATAEMETGAAEVTAPG